MSVAEDAYLQLLLRQFDDANDTIRHCESAALNALIYAFSGGVAIVASTTVYQYLKLGEIRNLSGIIQLLGAVLEPMSAYLLFVSAAIGFVGNRVHWRARIALAARTLAENELWSLVGSGKFDPQLCQKFRTDEANHLLLINLLIRASYVALIIGFVLSIPGLINIIRLEFHR